MKKRKWLGFVTHDTQLVLGFIALMSIGMYVVYGKVVLQQSQKQELQWFYNGMKTPDSIFKDHHLVAIDGTKDTYKDKSEEEAQTGVNTSFYKNNDNLLIKYNGLGINMCATTLLVWNESYSKQNIMKMTLNGAVLSGEIDEKKVQQLCQDEDNLFTFSSVK